MTRSIDRDRTLRSIAERFAPHLRAILASALAATALVFFAYFAFTIELLPRTRWSVTIAWLVAFVAIESWAAYIFASLFGPDYERDIVEAGPAAHVELIWPLAVLIALALAGFAVLYAAIFKVVNRCPTRVSSGRGAARWPGASAPRSALNYSRGGFGMSRHRAAETQIRWTDARNLLFAREIPIIES